MRILAAFALTSVLVTGTALAQANPPAPPKAKKDDSQKVICKTEDFVGSMIPRRICKTKADWQQGAIDAKDALDKGKMRLNPIALGNPNGGG